MHKQENYKSRLIRENYREFASKAMVYGTVPDSKSSSSTEPI